MLKVHWFLQVRARIQNFNFFLSFSNCLPSTIRQKMDVKDSRNIMIFLILPGYLKLLPLFLMVVPGMVARALFPDTVGCATEETCMNFCDSKVFSKLTVYFFKLKLMPAFNHTNVKCTSRTIFWLSSNLVL